MPAPRIHAASSDATTPPVPFTPDYQQPSSWLRASKSTLHFGPYQGRTIGEIGETDDGLLYLDNLYGEMCMLRRPVEMDPVQSEQLRGLLRDYCDDYTIRWDITLTKERRARQRGAHG